MPIAPIVPRIVETTAEEIATHRTEVDLLLLDDSMEEWAKTIHDSRHTLYPVCEDSADNVIGILNAKDYFRLEYKSRENIMREAVKPPFFVPETMEEYQWVDKKYSYYYTYYYNLYTNMNISLE